MNTPYIEHINLAVANIDDMVRFLTTAFPEFRVRHEGVNNGNRWMHVGTGQSYLALNQAPPDRIGELSNGRLNHFGAVVGDADAVRARLLAAGYREGFVTPDHRFRKRRYVIDGEGVEWEFVEYLSDDPAERNSYVD